jgi:hypothetical protein
MTGTRKGTAMERSARLARRVIDEIWNGGDLALADALFAPSYVNHGGLIPELVRGPEAIKVSVAGFRAAFPAFRLAVLDLLVQPATIALHWRAVADDRPGADAGSLSGMTFARLRHAQIVESWTCWERRPAAGRGNGRERSGPWPERPAGGPAWGPGPWPEGRGNGHRQAERTAGRGCCHDEAVIRRGPHRGGGQGAGPPAMGARRRGPRRPHAPRPLPRLAQKDVCHVHPLPRLGRGHMGGTAF